MVFHGIMKRHTKQNLGTCIPGTRKGKETLEERIGHVYYPGNHKNWIAWLAHLPHPGDERALSMCPQCLAPWPTNHNRQI
eukprot:1154299-Pelagomonas_calceolata.AAC.8